MRDTAIKVLLATVTVGLLTACSHERYPEKMVAVDSLATTHPDSARKVLASMATDTVFMSESQRMYYKLMTLKADIKSNITQTSSKRAREIINYYEHRGDQRLLPYAYFYAALTYNDINDAPQAIDYFQKVIETLPKDHDLQLESYAYNQIGKLFLFRDMDERALEYFKRSYQIDSIRKDTSDMIYALRDISMAYENKHLDTCKIFLQKAKQLNDKSKLKIGYEIDYRLSVIFCEHGEYDSAYLYLQEPLKNIKDMDSSAVFANARNIYMNKGMLDSAKYYSIELMRMGSIYAKRRSLKVLAKIAFAKGDNISGLKYIQLYDVFSDSVEKIKAYKALANANSLYNYNIREKENAHLKMEMKKYSYSIHILVILSCATITFLVIRNVKSVQKRQRLNFKVFLLTKIEKEQKNKVKNEIEVKKREISELTQRLQEAGKTNEELKKQLEEANRNLRIVVENVEKEKILKNGKRLFLLKSKAYSLTRAKLEAKEPISSDEWRALEKELECLFGDFKYILYQAYNMNIYEYHICLLVKMGFKNAEISTLVSREPNSVSQSRKRLYKKIIGKDGKAADFDEFIKSL